MRKYYLSFIKLSNWGNWEEINLNKISSGGVL